VNEYLSSHSAVRALHPARRLDGALGIARAIRSGVGDLGDATGLECPEIGQAGVPDLTSDAVQAKLLLGGTGVDLANEISELINQVQLKEPSISNADLTNGLIAA
jgi:hypothetical protein